MYTLQASTELFTSHKAAQILSDQSSFLVLQNSSGQSLFFGMSNSNLLYLSAEQDEKPTGWVPIDLTTELGSYFSGDTITLKSFSVRQSVTTGNITIAQIVHLASANTDVLVALHDLPNAVDADWMKSASKRSWGVFRNSNSVTLAYVTFPATDDGYAVVGQVGSNDIIGNYFVDLSRPGANWKEFVVPEDYNTLVAMTSGKSGIQHSGVYMLYTDVNGEASLIFTPYKGLYGAPPDPVKFTLPSGPAPTSIAVVPAGQAGETDLYLACSGAIYIYPGEDQVSGAAATEIISNKMIQDVTNLNAHVAHSKLTIWGRTNDGSVFYSRCKTGSQSDATAWSAPIPIQTGVDQLATMLNMQTKSSVLYAHTSGQQIVKLTQDPTTSMWHKQAILLPHSKMNDVAEFYTYTTKISVYDENNLPIANQAFTLTSDSLCSVYINDTYMTMSPSAGLQLASDVQGTVTIVQETQTLGAMCYNLAQGDGTSLNVNPMSTTVQRMSSIQSGSDLSSVQVTDEQGNTQPLVPTDVPAPNVDAVAQGIAQFVKTAGQLPQDGSLQPRSSEAVRLFDPADAVIWGMKFKGGDISYHSGPSQMEELGLFLNGETIALRTDSLQMDSIGSALESWAGDIWRWVESEWGKVERFFVTVADDITNFFIQIGDALYHFIMQCVNDVVHAVQFVLKEIKVGFDKLVQWIGFIFSWNDILRTHQVLKNIFNQYAQYCLAQISTVGPTLQGYFEQANASISQWAGINVPSQGTAGTFSSSSYMPSGASTPQANYGVSQAKGNIGSGNLSSSPVLNPSSNSADLLEELWNAIQSEETIILDAFKQINTQIFEQIGTLTAAEILKALIGIIAEALLETIENLVLTTIDVIISLAQGVLDVLNTPIDIPVLSWLYSKISGGDQLTPLDLIALITAIPVTIIGKIVIGQTPFPDNEFTTDLIIASSLSAIQTLYSEQTQSSHIVPMPSSAMDASADAILTLVGGISALFGGVAVAVTGFGKFWAPESYLWAAAYAGCYLPYVMPDITQLITELPKPTWDVDMNAAIAVVDVIKQFIDIAGAASEKDGLLKMWCLASPWIESMINIVWEAPVVAGLVDNQSTPAVIGFVANTLFNIGGILTPGTTGGPEDPPSLAIAVAQSGCAGLYGLLSCVQGGMEYNNPTNESNLGRLIPSTA